MAPVSEPPCSQVPVYAPGVGAKGRGGVFARRPLLPRLAGLRGLGSPGSSGPGGDGGEPSEAPLLVLFGDHDWLRPPGSGAEDFAAAAREVAGISHARFEVICRDGRAYNKSSSQPAQYFMVEQVPRP